MSGRVSYFGGIVKDNNLILSVDAGKLESYNRLGPTFFDLSGRQNNGTLTNFGTTRWSSLNGGAIVFDGNNDYVEFSDVPFRITNYNFTCEFVFYYTGGTYTNQTILGKRSSNSPFNQWAFGIYNGDPYNGGTGKVLIAFLRDDNNPNSNFNDRTLTYTLPSAGIYHVVLTNSQAQAQLWVNGVLRNTSTVALASGNFNITGFNFRIGNTYSASYWNDKIYLARFYNKTLTNSEITQNFNAIIPRFFPNVDYNAQDFINVAGITGTTEQTAINQLVIDLKSNSLWTKMVAVYPFVGGNATTHKFNLVNPQDTNAAYRLSFVGGWTHSSSGATPNGTNAYADTFLNGSTVLTANNSHVSFYSRTDVNTDGCDFGNTSNAFGPITRSGNVMYSDFLGNGSAFLASPDRITVTNNNSNANFIFSSTASNIKIYKNSSVLGQKGSATASGYPNSNILISYGFTSGANRYSTRQLAFFTIGGGLSDAEASTLYTIIQNFNTTLGRQV